MKIKETNSRVITDNQHKSSQGAVLKNLATKLVVPKEILPLLVDLLKL